MLPPLSILRKRSILIWSVIDSEDLFEVRLFECCGKKIGEGKRRKGVGMVLTQLGQPGRWSSDFQWLVEGKCGTTHNVWLNCQPCMEALLVNSVIGHDIH